MYASHSVVTNSHLTTRATRFLSFPCSTSLASLLSPLPPCRPASSLSSDRLHREARDVRARLAGSPGSHRQRQADQAPRHCRAPPRKFRCAAPVKGRTGARGTGAAASPRYALILLPLLLPLLRECRVVIDADSEGTDKRPTNHRREHERRDTGCRLPAVQAGLPGFWLCRVRHNVPSIHPDGYH